MTARLPILARLTGRCANGAERDGGHTVHVVLAEPGMVHLPVWGTAVCGAKPGRLSNGWVEPDGPEVPTCPRCRQRTTPR